MPIGYGNDAKRFPRQSEPQVLINHNSTTLTRLLQTKRHANVVNVTTSSTQLSHKWVQTRTHSSPVDAHVRLRPNFAFVSSFGISIRESPCSTYLVGLLMFSCLVLLACLSVDLESPLGGTGSSYSVMWPDGGALYTACFLFSVHRFKGAV